MLAIQCCTFDYDLRKTQYNFQICNNVNVKLNSINFKKVELMTELLYWTVTDYTGVPNKVVSECMYEMLPHLHASLSLLMGWSGSSWEGPRHRTRWYWSAAACRHSILQYITCRGRWVHSDHKILEIKLSIFLVLWVKTRGGKKGFVRIISINFNKYSTSALSLWLHHPMQHHFFNHWWKPQVVIT